VVQILSLVGAGVSLGAYASLQRGWLSATSFGYNLLNLLSSVLLLYVAVRTRTLGFIVLNVAWGSLTIPALKRSLSYKGGSKSLECRREEPH
jgi:hypothetical protein